MTLADRLHAVRDAVARAAERAGRADVHLVAVSKTQPVEAIREAYAAGQRDFGENYPQELRDKAAALADLPDLRWHFIGRLQTNKARYVAPVAVRVHALDSVEQAAALARRSDARVRCLVAVNLAGEATKGGVRPDAALPLCREASAHVDVVGLMTMPPWSEDPEAAAPLFARLRALAAQGRDEGLDLVELSMGMSHDWPVAVREGATWVRVGTAIFGERT